MQTLIDSHYLSLPSQGNIFLSVKFQKIDGTTKILVASIKRKLYLIEYQYMETYFEPVTKEISFTCIQTGSEISSIDVLNRSKTIDDFVVGIVVLKQSDNGYTASLNLYSEYDMKPDTHVTMDTIGQNCEMLTLGFIPYGLYHCELSPHRTNGKYENLWLLAGGDHKIHGYKCSYDDRHHVEVTVDDLFPEFVDLSSIVLSLNIFHYNDYQNRISCVGCEDGYVRCCVVDCINNNVLQNLNTHYENPISGVQLFTLGMLENPAFKFSPRDDGTHASKKNSEINLLIINTVYHSEVFMNVLDHGFEKRHCLIESTLYDVCLCSVIADVDFDGVNELILGTYGEKLLLFKYIDEKWVFADKKSVPNPVYKLFYEDLTEDGICELISVTSKGVHIYQHKLKRHILPILLARMKRLLS